MAEHGMSAGYPGEEFMFGGRRDRQLGEAYEEVASIRRDKIRKAKAQNELNLATTVKDKNIFTNI